MSSRDTLTESEVHYALRLGERDEVPWLPELARDNLRVREALRRSEARVRKLQSEIADRETLHARLERQVERLEQLQSEAG